MNKLLFYFTLFLLIETSMKLHSQNEVLLTDNIKIPDTIRIKNPSFEGKPGMGGAQKWQLQGWEDFGHKSFPWETPPDIHPKNYWENNVPAKEGKTYLGMVTRDNGSKEAVAQKLDKSLLACKYYTFSCYLSQATLYKSPSKTTNKIVNFNHPIVLTIWGANEDQMFLLAESPPISNNEWIKYSFTFHPIADLKLIILEVNFDKRMNGNILLDAASDIIEIEKPE